MIGITRKLKSGVRFAKSAKFDTDELKHFWTSKYSYLIENQALQNIFFLAWAGSINNNQGSSQSHSPSSQWLVKPHTRLPLKQNIPSDLYILVEALRLTEQGGYSRQPWEKMLC